MSEKTILTWQQLGQYEHEHDGHSYTGWCRAIGGRLKCGCYPEHHNVTGKNRYTGNSDCSEHNKK
jgi:hypothetical protein